MQLDYLDLNDIQSNADISKFSYFCDEEEVLFYPFSTFSVEKIEKINENLTKITLVNLTKYKEIVNKIMDKFKDNYNYFQYQANNSTFYTDISNSKYIESKDALQVSYKRITNKPFDPKEIEEFEVKGNENDSEDNEDLENIENKKNIILGKYKEDIIKFLPKFFLFPFGMQIFDYFKIINENEENNKNEKIYDKFIFFLNGFEINSGNFLSLSGSNIFPSNKNYDIKLVFKMPLSEIKFKGCNSLISLNLSYFDMSNIINMSDMFSCCCFLEYLTLSDSIAPEFMDNLFYKCFSLKIVNLSNINTSKVKSMKNMFYECSSLKTLNLSNFDTSKVEDMSYMFYGCTSLCYLDLSNFDTSNVKNMNHMFSRSKLKYVDISSFRTPKLVDMGSMFSHCDNLLSLDLSYFDASNVTNMNGLFNGCSGLTFLDISSLYYSNKIEDYNNVIKEIKSEKCKINFSNGETKEKFENSESCLIF